MLACCNGLTNITRAIRFDDSSCGKMHTDDHGSRSTVFGYLLNNQGSCSDAFSQTSNVLCTDQAEKSSLTKCFEGCSREGTCSVNFDSSRSDNLSNNLFKWYEIELRG